MSKSNPESAHDIARCEGGRSGNSDDFWLQMADARLNRHSFLALRRVGTGRRRPARQSATTGHIVEPGDRMTRYRTFALIPGLVFTLVLGVHGAGAQTPSDDNRPVIRQFDIPTVEKLGRAMYEQDQFAWKATDIAIAHLGEDGLKAQKTLGWLVETTATGTVVRFVHDTIEGPKFYFDVHFSPEGAAQTSIPTEASLDEQEMAQWRARTLALANITRRCSDHYNTVILKDPEHDGWLVWVMAATTDPNVAIMGGHYRFSVSPDGQKITEKDALSNGCLTLPKSEITSGSNATSFVGQQFVSLGPLETSVFASISYKLPIFIGTLDGKVWKYDADTISSPDAETPSNDGLAARALLGIAEKCRIIATKPDETPPKYYVQGDTTVINATERSNAFHPEVAPGYKAVSVMCGRLDIVPMPNDYKVLLAGYTLFISDIGAGHPKRLGSLEMVNGQFQFRTTQGPPPTDEQLAKINARLNVFQDAIQKKQ
jgi:hypothetical protein